MNYRGHIYESQLYYPNFINVIWYETKVSNLTIEVFGTINWKILHFENSFGVRFVDVDIMTGDEFL